MDTQRSGRRDRQKRDRTPLVELERLSPLDPLVLQTALGGKLADGTPDFIANSCYYSDHNTHAHPSEWSDSFFMDIVLLYWLCLYFIKKYGVTSPYVMHFLDRMSLPPSCDLLLLYNTRESRWGHGGDMLTRTESLRSYVAVATLHYIDSVDLQLLDIDVLENLIRGEYNEV